MRRIVIVYLLPLWISSMALVGQAHSSNGATDGHALDPDPAAIVARFVAAFNARDVDAMAELLTEDAAWYYIQGGSIAQQDGDRAGIQASLVEYFASFPTVRSEIVDVISLTPYVSVIERVRWEHDGDAKSQAAIAVYELHGNQINAVWYFPEVTD